MFIALTFDDGTMHQYNSAKLLFRHGIRCTLFCITHLKKHPNTGKQLITTAPEKIRELYYMGHEIASHTCSHPDLRLVTPKRLEKELRDSKHKLETIIDEEVLGFAYPYSLYNVHVLKKVKEEYFYARGGPLPEDQLTMSLRDRYRISSIGIKKTMTLPFRSIYWENTNNIPLVIMMHDIPTSILFSLIYYLRVISKARFVTMKEMIDQSIYGARKKDNSLNYKYSLFTHYEKSADYERGQNHYGDGRKTYRKSDGYRS